MTPAQHRCFSRLMHPFLTGLDVQIISPHVDNYEATPASRVADGSVDLCITPSESILSHYTWPDASKPKLTAVASVLQSSSSAIVTLASSGLDRPSKLDGKVYASYGARYEGRIVQQMIINDGGSGKYVEAVLPMLGIWSTLLEGKADATWVFMGWEGVEAEQKGVKLNVFPLEDFNIPYGYSPVIAARNDALDGPKAAEIASFLKATARGYKFAAKEPEAAARVFLTAVKEEFEAAPLPQPLDDEMVIASHQYTAKHFLNADQAWGRMEEGKWDRFVDWLDEKGLITSKVQSRKGPSDTTASLDGLRDGDVGARIPRESIDVSKLFTNRLL